MNAFDPTAYKATTREQWQVAAAAWQRWGPVLEDWLGDATARMLDAAGVEAGSFVLDIAAGAGGQSLAAARRTGPEGRVLATDISPAILAFAAQSAAKDRLKNVETLELDGEAADSLQPESFDAVISRLGLIYFPDQQRALSGMRRALRAGGRIGAIVYSTAERNPFFSVPVRIIRTAAEPGPPSSLRSLPPEGASAPSERPGGADGPPAPGQPGPFSLGGPGVLQAALEQAGFRDVNVQSVSAPLRLPSAADCVRFEQESFGALHQMLSTVPADEQPAVWHRIGEELRSFETADGFVGPCELLVAGATR